MLVFMVSGLGYVLLGGGYSMKERPDRNCYFEGPCPLVIECSEGECGYRRAQRFARILLQYAELMGVDFKEKRDGSS